MDERRMYDEEDSERGNLPGSPGWSSIINKIYMALEMLQKGQKLLRFIDQRNPETNTIPLPDGSNILHGDLRSSWALHRVWIRALHHRSLYVGKMGYGSARLRDILVLSFAFLAVECVKLEPPPPLTPYPELTLLQTELYPIFQAIQAVGNDMLIEHRPVPRDGGYTQLETIHFNLYDSTYLTASYDRVRYCNLQVRKTPLIDTSAFWASREEMGIMVTPSRKGCDYGETVDLRTCRGFSYG